MTDLEPQVQQQAQATIQQIVERMRREYAGADVEQTRAALAGAIADAGLPEQPQKWVSDTAGEVSAGRAIVVDREVRAEGDSRRQP